MDMARADHLPITGLSGPIDTAHTVCCTLDPTFSEHSCARSFEITAPREVDHVSPIWQPDKQSGTKPDSGTKPARSAEPRLASTRSSSADFAFPYLEALAS